MRAERLVIGVRSPLSLRENNVIITDAALELFRLLKFINILIWVTMLWNRAELLTYLMWLFSLAIKKYMNGFTAEFT